jgi:hypothetical protein
VAGDQGQRLSERAVYLRPAGVPGVEALHAEFVRHAYRPHSHPTWTVAVIERGATAFDVDVEIGHAHEGHDRAPCAARLERCCASATGAAGSAA